MTPGRIKFYQQYGRQRQAQRIRDARRAKLRSPNRRLIIFLESAAVILVTLVMERACLNQAPGWFDGLLWAIGWGAAILGNWRVGRPYRMPWWLRWRITRYKVRRKARRTRWLYEPANNGREEGNLTRVSRDTPNRRIKTR